MAGSASFLTDSPVDDADRTGTYHFLDVGGLKYGECTLVEFGAVRILIDGSHSKDFAGQAGYRSIPEQLRDILGEPPYDIAMVVVTHCHADHVGCLPELVSKNIIRPKFALVTDPELGFGRAADDDDSARDAADPRVRLQALLREEDASDLNDSDLAEFIDAAATVESRYASFLKTLTAKGTEVIRYRGQDLPARLARLLAPTGVKLLGPSEEQLFFCAEQIATTNKEADDAADSAGLDSDAGLIELYRSMARADADAFRNPRGNGMNCQSITFAFGPPEARVLLAGDMQFTEPGVKGADAEVEKLRERVAQQGPYKLFKTTHHTSHNGQDEAFLTSIGDPELIVHSGGLHDTKHPFPDLLKMLKGRGKIRFARTDRNGVITVKPHLRPDRAIEVTKGRLNDFTPNRPQDAAPLSVASPVVLPPSLQPVIEATAKPAAGAQIIIVNLPNAPIDMTVAGVDIRIRAVGGVSGPRHMDPLPSGPPYQPSSQGGDFSVGRSLEKLLFVTDRAKLQTNIGRAEADSALDAVAKAGGIVVSSNGQDSLNETRRALKRDPQIKGVVLLGGYDVVPSTKTDVLDPELRRILGRQARLEKDQFLVWSDNLYGDSDDDMETELPVSRVPDARDAGLFLSALRAAPFQAAERFGIRNSVREFAETVWHAGVGGRPLKVSEPFLSTEVVAADVDAACHYFMLHGKAHDGREFTGNVVGADRTVVAFTIDKVPAKFSGVVFSGCCWGALIVDGKASPTTDPLPPPRLREASIALSYLKAGANAYIGCTGAHYSGEAVELDDNFAARLHRDFWVNLAQPGCAPADALHKAKQSFTRWIVAQGNNLDPLTTARKLKNSFQFTCLGLGW